MDQLKIKEEELRELISECSFEGWDGYSAIPIVIEISDFVQYLLRKIPEHIRMPDLTPCPDGIIDLEWRESYPYLYHLTINVDINEIYLIWSGQNSKGSQVFKQDCFAEKFSQILEIHFSMNKF